MNDIQSATSRFDELQAAFLRVRLCHLDKSNECRQKIARLYLETLECLALSKLSFLPGRQIEQGGGYSKINEDKPGWQRIVNCMPLISNLVLPFVATLAAPVWHLFVIRRPQRDAVQTRLAEAGIGTLIYCLVPPHLSAAIPKGALPIAEEMARTVLSLPMGPHLSAAGAAAVARAVRESCSI